MQIQDLSQEMKALEAYLKQYPSEMLSEQFLIENPKYQPLISHFFIPKKKELAEWMKTPYKKCTHEKEALVHPTNAGFCVRSKSEVMIVACLMKYQIPFRYECELLLGKEVFYPDFTIRHPKTGELFYWEHFGRMDDPKYRRKCWHKLQKFGDYGIIPTINLITTYEDSKHPLSIKEIEKMVQEYFLLKCKDDFDCVSRDDYVKEACGEALAKKFHWKIWWEFAGEKISLRGLGQMFE